MRHQSGGVGSIHRHSRGGGFPAHGTAPPPAGLFFRQCLPRECQRNLACPAGQPSAEGMDSSPAAWGTPFPVLPTGGEEKQHPLSLGLRPQQASVPNPPSFREAGGLVSRVSVPCMLWSSAYSSVFLASEHRKVAGTVTIPPLPSFFKNSRAFSSGAQMGDRTAGLTSPPCTLKGSTAARQAKIQQGQQSLE